MKIDAAGSDEPRERPRGREIHLAARRDREELQTLLRSPPQFAGGMRDERRAMPGGAQPEDGQEHLVLAAPPAPRGVDVQ